VKVDKKTLVTAITFLLIGIIGTSIVWVYASSAGTFYLSEGIYPSADSYTLWREGSTYYAKNAYGQIPSWGSGTNIRNISESVVNALSSGGSMFYQRGTYITDDDIDLDDDIEVYGEGTSTIFQFGTGKGGGDKYIFDVNGSNATHKSNVKIRNMKLIATEASDHAIRLRYADDCLIENIWATHSNKSGSIDEAISIVSDARRNTLLNVKVTNFGVHGIELISLDVGNYVQDNTLINPTITNCQRGLNFRGNVRYNTVLGGKIYANDVIGVQFYALGIGAGCHSNTMIGTEVSGNGQSGIKIEDSSKNHFIGMFILNNAEQGIYSNNESATELLIQGCRIVAPTGKRPIDLHSNSGNCTIIGNDLESDTLSLLYPSKNIVEDNLGYVTENSGNATITASTSVVVNHGLVGTPTSVQITRSAVGMGDFYVDTLTSTQFTIHVGNSGTWTLYWYAEYKP